jgi:hypothetical protein
MNESVDVPGTGAFPVWGFQRSTGRLGEFEIVEEVSPFNAHTRVQVYWTRPDGRIEQIDSFDPWWRLPF